MKFRGLLLSLAILTGMGGAQSLHCNLQNYKAIDGLQAEASGSTLSMTWQGEGGQQLRARFTLRNGQPVVEELAARQGSDRWIVLGKDLTPDFQVTTGRRRISGAQRNELKKLNLDTPEQEDIRKWNTFLGCAAGGTRRGRHHRSAALEIGNHSRVGKLPVEQLHRGQHGRAGERYLRRSEAGHLLRRSALHRVQGIKPAAAGSHCQNSAAFGRIHL